jgi:hypothetical protein
MDRPKSKQSPELEKFLDAILDRPDHERTKAFVAQILGEHNFNPNEPRNRRGEWTTGGSDDGPDDWGNPRGWKRRAGLTGGGIAYQGGRSVGTGISRFNYPTPREREAIEKYDRTITVFVGHSADVIKAAEAAAAEINSTRGIRSAKIAGIGCGGGSEDINKNLQSHDAVRWLVPGGLQQLPTAVGRSATFAGVGRIGKLPDINERLLRTEDALALNKKMQQGPPEVAKAEAINRAFVNGLVKQAIDSLANCDGHVRIRIEQLPERSNTAFTVQDLAKEAGIRNGARETIFGHKVVWTFDGDDLVGDVY